MADLTPAEALGRGTAYDDDWDFRTRGGSIALFEGFDELGQDLAFAVTDALDEDLGRLPTPEDREDIRITVRRIANGDSRIARIDGEIAVEEADQPAGTLKITVPVVASTGERGDAVLTI